MKAEIMTMQAVNNYGSVLQTYALCEMFRARGIEAEVIDYYPQRLKGYGSLGQLYRDARPFHGSRWRCWLVAIVNWPSYRLQARVFVPFKRQYIRLSRKYESFPELAADYPAAELYCTGSDQVWNNYLDAEGRFDPAYFLQFGSPQTKRIAYAASFGRSDFTPEERQAVADYLKRYDAVSTREITGLQVIGDCPVPLRQCCLDPTLMLPAAQWRALMQPIKQKNYILVYQLHEDSLAVQVALAAAKLLGYRVLRLSTALHRGIRGGTTVLLPSVEQYLTYIQNARLVVTDSFHATAFAVNLNVPFLAVRWKLFNDRIDSLLQLTGLQARSVSSVQQAMQAVAKPIDFEQVNRLLAAERQNSEAFFQKAIQLSNGENGL